MRDIRQEIKEETYKLSQSRLKKLADHPLSFLQTKQSEATGASSFSVGSYIEDVLYERLDPTYQYKHKYCSPKYSPPTGQMKKFCDYLYKDGYDFRSTPYVAPPVPVAVYTHTQSSTANTSSVYITGVSQNPLMNSALSITSTTSKSVQPYLDYLRPLVGGNLFDLLYMKIGFKRDSKGVVCQKFVTQCWDWYHELIDNKGKGLITPNIVDMSAILIDEMLTNSDTGFHLTKKPTEELIIQANYTFKLPKGEYKILGTSQPDVVFIDHTNKKIRLVEVKTSDSNSDASFVMYRYDIQIMWYALSLMVMYPEYEITKVFITGIYKKVKDEYVFRKVKPTYLSERDENIAVKGLIKNGKIEVEGIDQLLDRYIYHVTHDVWDFPMEYYTDSVKYFTTDLWK